MADGDKEETVEDLGNDFITLDRDGKTENEDDQKFAPRIDDGEDEIQDRFDSGDEDRDENNEEDDENDDDGSDDESDDDGELEESSDDETGEEDDDSSDEEDVEDAGDDDGDDTSDDDDDDEEEDVRPKKKKKQSPSERISQAIKKQRQAERRAEAAEQRARELEEAQQKKLTPEDEGDKTESTKSENDDNAPDPTKFLYGELDPKYIAALTKYETQKVLAAEKLEREKESEEAKAAEARKDWQEKYHARIDAGAEVYEDFEEVVVKGADEKKYPLTTEVAQMAIVSPVGHHVIYEIASNPELAKKLAQMSVIEQAQEFGRLSARYEKTTNTRKKQPNTKPKAPPPPKKRRGNKGVNQFNPETASFEDFEKMANKHLFGEKK